MASGAFLLTKEVHLSLLSVDEKGVSILLVRVLDSHLEGASVFILTNVETLFLKVFLVIEHQRLGVVLGEFLHHVYDA